LYVKKNNGEAGPISNWKGGGKLRIPRKKSTEAISRQGELKEESTMGRAETEPLKRDVKGRKGTTAPRDESGLKGGGLLKESSGREERKRSPKETS